MPCSPARSTLLTAVVSLSLLTSAAAQSAPPVAPAPQKVALIRQILDATHAADQLLTAMEASVAAQRTGNPQIPAAFWDRFLTRARERRGEFIDSLVPLYSRSFEVAELRGLLQFYRSALGQRLLQIQPELMGQSMQLGQRWGARLGAEVGQELAAEGDAAQP